MRRSALTTVLLLLLTQLVAVAWPAYACGCGGMVTDPDTPVTVQQETSAVRWDGTTEQIVMSLTVDGEAPEAAWIMPVPSRAEVELGDRELFNDLRAVTAPRHETRHYFWPREGDWPLGSEDDEGDGALPGAPPPTRESGVDVISREQLGPFDVARLAADDPDALDNWLGENGFTLPERLGQELTPYVERGWEYVAIRLTPAKTDGADPAETVLGGTLDPISLTFASDELIYPMRLSRAARTEQSLKLYVLGPGRMEPASHLGGNEPEVQFAAALPTEDQPEGPLRDLAAGETFLTVLDQDFPRPELIEGDHVLERAAADTEYIPVVYEDELLTVGGVPAWLLTMLAAVVAIAASGTAAARASAARRRTRRLYGVHPGR
ncbi:DUF2330 domain-containing protein [Streptomyces litchfieldiae]|uniref:DUF2330 domain-containing protein n=1 Tax=Streptomyces litchfieldiae TaxID=3075543 RepID=A0ABU2MUU1_9ACTN|nr:DUF2330 domain-containing protein [Streptomyces sp. DSM 44938]MDT0345410.1 DUF2330 domain-containing protein [Streptomyces sp. DSM 44938]